MYKKPLIVFFSVMITVGLFAGNSFADMDMGGMSSSKTTVVTSEDRDKFTDLWKKAFAAGSVTADQTKRLGTELETASQKLAENYTGLNGLLEQKKMAKASETASIDKRIDLKEAERDLIVSLEKLKLEEFLTKEQVNLLMIAGFHGISMSLSGEKHLDSLHGQMSTQMDNMEQLAMDLGKLAEKLNQNCQAVSLDLIRSTLGK